MDQYQRLMSRARYGESGVARCRGVSAAILFAGVAVMLAPTTTLSQPVSLPLSAAIDSALLHNERYLTVLAQMDRAEGQILSARAGLFPKIDLHADYLRDLELPKIVFGGEEFTVGTKYTVAGGLTFDQTLFEGGGVFSAWAAAQQYRSMNEHLARQARLDLEAQVAIAYFDALLLDQLAEVARQTLRLSEEHAALVAKKFADGIVSEYDNLSARVRLANARPPVIQAENDLRLALLRLTNLIGMSQGVRLAIADTEPDSANWEDAPTDELIAMAHSTRPDLAATSHQIVAIDKAVGVLRAERWPSLHLTGVFDYQALTDDSWPNRDDYFRSWQVGLSASYSLFDGFRRRGNIQVLRVDQREAELQQIELERAVALQIDGARSGFEEASARMAAQGETVTEAERGLAIANTRYESGVGTQLEVLDAQVALATARVYAATALHDRRVARVRWRLAMGAPVLAEGER